MAQTVPDFPTWDRKTLNQFARDAFLRLQEQEQALQQAREDLHFAMEQLRALQKK